MGRKLKRNRQKKSNKTSQENKRGDIEKWRPTDSAEIPDRGETSEIPGLPLGGGGGGGSPKRK